MKINLKSLSLEEYFVYAFWYSRGATLSRIKHIVGTLRTENWNRMNRLEKLAYGNALEQARIALNEHWVNKRPEEIMIFIQQNLPFHRMMDFIYRYDYQNYRTYLKMTQNVTTNKSDRKDNQNS